MWGRAQVRGWESASVRSGERARGREIVRAVGRAQACGRESVRGNEVERARSGRLRKREGAWCLRNHGPERGKEWKIGDARSESGVGGEGGWGGQWR